jgi:hypothetical protein
MLMACAAEGTTEPALPESTEANLLSLSFSFSGSVFSTNISGTDITLKRPLPYGTTHAIISSVALSKNTTCTVKPGDQLELSGNPVAITVTNTKSGKIKTYQLTLTARDYASVVARHGLLRTQGNQVVDHNGEPVSLAGNSFFWSNNQWGGERFYNASVVQWLKLDWETQIIRAAMGVNEPGGYTTDQASNRNRVKTLVEAAIDAGIYVIIDWHSHHAEDYEVQAIDFFKEMATLYGGYDNVIYEIYNEPLNISWPDKLKPYAEHVISAIREIDPDNMIIVGTPEWSQRVDLAAADPITISDNIAYTLHFYTVYHKQWLRDRADAALAQGIPLFITEWGSVGYTQSDPETDAWMAWCKEKGISHCNWAVNDKAEEWSILIPGSGTTGNWTDQSLSEAGKLAREIVRGW